MFDPVRTWLSQFLLLFSIAPLDISSLHAYLTLCMLLSNSLFSLGSCYKGSPWFTSKCIQCTLLECSRSSVFCTMSAI